MPHTALANRITPHKLVHGTITAISTLKIFGRDCVILYSDADLSKEAPEALS